MKIFWSPLAVERLEEIYEFIANQDTNAAGKVIKRIFTRVNSLSKYPERGRFVPEANRKDIREVFECGYRIIYRVESSKIYLLTIRSHKQLLPEGDTK